MIHSGFPTDPVSNEDARVHSQLTDSRVHPLMVEQLIAIVPFNIHFILLTLL
jgi:hypothetical protein